MDSLGPRKVGLGVGENASWRACSFLPTPSATFQVFCERGVDFWNRKRIAGNQTWCRQICSSGQFAKGVESATFPAGEFPTQMKGFLLSTFLLYFSDFAFWNHQRIPRALGNSRGNQASCESGRPRWPKVADPRKVADLFSPQANSHCFSATFKHA